MICLTDFDLLRGHIQVHLATKRANALSTICIALANRYLQFQCVVYKGSYFLVQKYEEHTH